MPTLRAREGLWFVMMMRLALRGGAEALKDLVRRAEVTDEGGRRLLEYLIDREEAMQKRKR